MKTCQHIGSCWDQRCEAISRKTGERCPHLARAVIPNTLAGHFVADAEYFQVEGRPVHLCKGHSSSWWARRKRLLSVRLCDGGYLSAYNSHGYGSVVSVHERIDFDRKITIPKGWPAVSWRGRVPEKVAAALRLESK